MAPVDRHGGRRRHGLSADGRQLGASGYFAIERFERLYVVRVAEVEVETREHRLESTKSQEEEVIPASVGIREITRVYSDFGETLLVVVDTGRSAGTRMPSARVRHE